MGRGENRIWLHRGQLFLQLGDESAKLLGTLPHENAVFAGCPLLSFKSSEMNSADFKVLLRKTLVRRTRGARFRA